MRHGPCGSHLHKHVNVTLLEESDYIYFSERMLLVFAAVCTALRFNK